MVELTQADRDRAADTWRDYVAKLGECIVERAMRSGNMDDSSFAQAFASHRTQSTAALAAENERLRGLLTAAAQETVALRVMLGAGCDANNDEHHEIIGTGKDAFCHKCGEMTPRGKSKAWFSEERMERIMNRLAARAALDGK